jgi:hypothetical protein
MNRAEELMMALLGDGRGAEQTLRLGASPPLPSPDPPDDDEVSVSSEFRASRYSFAPSTDARLGVPWNAADRTAAAALTLVLLEAEYSAALLASALLRPSCPNGGGAVADAGHRYVFWLASDTLARAAAPEVAPDLFFSGVAAGAAAGDLALLDSKE